MTQPFITCGTDHPHRRGRRRVRALLGAAVALAVFSHLSAQSALLKVERDGDRLRLSAPQFHVLTGTPLQRLRDGRSVTYVFSASLQVERGGARGASLTRQVIFSYDLWEERFSVAQVDDPKVARSHLTAAAAEAWCLELLALPVRAAPADKTFVVKLECSLREEGAQAADAPSAATFTGLIDLLSRKTRAAPPRWEAVSLPQRLADIKDKAPK
ncbi:MAG TPA: hypothetical protein VGK32_15195 [Vicinamibacterales bacterium]|jgi:hypothetical protein